MATRSTIAIKNSDNTISLIYSHWDGYLEGVGKILKEHYSDENKIRQLLKEGDISSLDETISTTIFYARDRDETGVSAKVLKDLKDSNYVQNYNYLWENGKWLVSLWDEMDYKEF